MSRAQPVFHGQAHLAVAEYQYLVFFRCHARPPSIASVIQRRMTSAAARFWRAAGAMLVSLCAWPPRLPAALFSFRARI
jgi:hypothetical protein